MKKKLAFDHYAEWGERDPWWIEELEEDLDRDAIELDEYGFSQGYYGD